MSKHVHTRLNDVHTCLYLKIYYKHVCTMYIHCKYMFILFPKCMYMNVHVHTFSEKYVHVGPMYVIGM